MAFVIYSCVLLGIIVNIFLYSSSNLEPELENDSKDKNNFDGENDLNNKKEKENDFKYDNNGGDDEDEEEDNEKDDGVNDIKDLKADVKEIKDTIKEIDKALDKNTELSEDDEARNEALDVIRDRLKEMNIGGRPTREEARIALEEEREYMEEQQRDLECELYKLKSGDSTPIAEDPTLTAGNSTPTLANPRLTSDDLNFPNPNNSSGSNNSRSILEKIIEFQDDYSLNDFYYSFNDFYFSLIDLPIWLISLFPRLFVIVMFIALISILKKR